MGAHDITVTVTIKSYCYGNELKSYTVYALTFEGLNFRSFRGSIAIRESFILRKIRPDRQRLCNYVTNRENKHAKNAQIGNPRKFNPAKIKADTVRNVLMYILYINTVYYVINIVNTTILY